ncbi:uncharacterized protein PITG_11860 [Phytophthora infestans T30-4]|uniref:Uncharacterized protein n=1 Tax=Phytophthora infestans (strain T30-4) TaxID=403677 RepID=D0NHE8_PHYIT|nr:uncharacterized protein PITG_11860 [Phytophthora infestans T30-4]EEY58873.1 hypothetical protein PITG_11860 [Phytophthora infestans T30-4]|eukprot:XP_002901346.1 hypothetical protein PITG_11860 [Phytophthora infestans T30-4]
MVGTPELSTGYVFSSNQRFFSAKVNCATFKVHVIDDGSRWQQRQKKGLWSGDRGAAPRLSYTFPTRR